MYLIGVIAALALTLGSPGFAAGLPSTRSNAASAATSPGTSGNALRSDGR
jgi:hypothetical protein